MATVASENVIKPFIKNREGRGFLFLIGFSHVIAIGLLFTSLLGGGSGNQSSLIINSNSATRESNNKDGEIIKEYDRLVLFVVDALRADMVSDRPEMKYVRSLLSTGDLIGYIARAHAPTVTMPRIKALMSGNVPQFLDLITNLASTSTQQDSLIHRLKQSGKRMTLFGDDTWLKLFPEAFSSRSDGTTSSFFTPDFVEVDENVTRHIDQDFDGTTKHPLSLDWDVSILHYLGLDHVGHQLGPNSPRMSEKLIEMDQAFKRVLEGVHQQDAILGTKTLVVLLSDHGMNGAGSHGGSSPQETSAVAIFSQPQKSLDLNSIVQQNKLVLQEAFQVDIAPTLGLALGVGIPNKSVGCVLKGAFSSDEIYQKGLRRNLVHLKQSLGDLHSEDAQTFESPEIACNSVQERLLAKSQRPDASSSVLEMFKQTFAICVLIGIVSLQMIRLQGRKSNFPSLLASGALLLQLLGFASSSAIENEHATVFFTLASMVVGMIFQPCQNQQQRFMIKDVMAKQIPNLVGVGIFMRIMRSRLEIINFARLSGISNREFLNEGTALLPLVPGLGGDDISPIVARIGLTGLVLKRFLHEHDVYDTFLMSVSLLLTWIFSIYGEEVKLAARSALYLYLLLFIRGFALAHTRTLIGTMIGLGLLVVRPSLLPIVGLGIVSMILVDQYKQQQQPDTNSWDVLTMYWLIGLGMFYGMGNSHSVSTIDISGGYVGSDEYSREKVAFITAFVVYFGPLLASAFSLHRGFAEMDARMMLFLFQSSRLAFSSIITVMMQNHLFIWSVFAPRWGYEILFTLLLDMLLIIWPN